MAIAYLIDENLRGTLIVALMGVATRYGLKSDVLQVGDHFAPALGTKDPDLLLWAERDQRILVSQDKKSMRHHLDEHHRGGHKCPGIFRLRARPLTDMAEELVLISFASNPEEWQGKITYIPQ